MDFYLLVATARRVFVVLRRDLWLSLAEVELPVLDLDFATARLVTRVVQRADLRSYSLEIWRRGCANLDFVHRNFWEKDALRGYSIEIVNYESVRRYTDSSCRWSTADQLPVFSATI